MKYIILGIIWLVIAVSGQHCPRQWSLPEKCVCSSTDTVECNFANLRHVPAGNIPRYVTSLDLRHNDISVVHLGNYPHPNELRKLLLGHNVISRLEDDTFFRLSALQDLWINSNGLTTIMQDAFRGLTRLETLHLENNRLATLRPLLFANIPALERLFLQHNEITRLPGQILPSLPKLKNLQIGGNPWHCDCHILPVSLHLLRWSANASGATSSRRWSLGTLNDDAAMCATPSRRPVISLQEDAEFLDNCGYTRDDALPDTLDPQRNRRQSHRLPLPAIPPSRPIRPSHPRAPAPAVPGAPPVITNPPHGLEMRIGERQHMTCSANGQPRPTITWKKDGVVLGTPLTAGLRVDGGTVHFDSAAQGHNGLYECVARNLHGTATAKARVRVMVTPRIIEAPKDSIAYVGGRMTLRCRADGYPSPSLTWIHNGIPTPTTFVHDISRDGTELSFLNITLEDAGVYRCLAQNSAGTDGSSAVLTVFQDISLVPDTMDVRGQLIPEVNRVVDRARDHIDLDEEAEEDADSSLELAGHRRLQLTPGHVSNEQLRISPETEALRATFGSSLRVMDEKVKRGMVFQNVQAFRYNESIPFLHIQLMANMSGCAIHRRMVRAKDCSACYHKKYRTFDGTCNNLKNPMQGASQTALKRLIPPVYADGLSQPVGGVPMLIPEHKPGLLPTARVVSTKVLSTLQITPDERHSHMLMQWGQFLDHDLSFTVMAPSHELFTTHANCKTDICTTEPPCFPIPVYENDPRIDRNVTKCMEFIRSRPVCGSGTSSVLFGQLMHREQINSLTSYIDASMIYGASEPVARHIRDLSSRGLLRGSLPAPGTELPLLPYNDPLTAPEEIDCKRVRYDERNFPCFTAGEIRVNEQLGLLAMHTLWFREHNRIAEKLGEVNPLWSGEKVYQESRKIVGALVQHITYQQWLPKILGTVGMQLLGNYTGYREDVDAAIANSFATATLRMGHSTIFPVLRRLNATFQTIPAGDLNLHETFFAPHRLFDHGGIDPLLRGLFGSPAKLLHKTQLMNSELIDKLFAQSTRTHRMPLDLGAFNIQRGRDHGLPSYTAFRRFCNLAVPTTFAGLRGEVDAEQLRRLEEVYEEVDRVDLFAGAMSERPLPGAKIGATFMCLLVEQFRRVRDGDRFWYEKSGVFSSEQLAEIRKGSLARILCDNTDTVDRVQRDVFFMATAQPGGYVWCENLPALDLGQWKECCEDCYATRLESGRTGSGVRVGSETDNLPFNPPTGPQRRGLRNKRAADGDHEAHVGALQQEVQQLQELVAALRKELRARD